MALEQLSRTDVADLLGIDPKSVDKYRQRGIMPEPDGHVGRSPWWHKERILVWDANRRKAPRREGN